MEKQKQEAATRAFYDECVQFGLTKAKKLTPDKRQRMELLAKKHAIPFTSLEDLQKVIAQFKPIVEDEQRRAHEEKIRKLKEQETAEYKTLTLYAKSAWPRQASGYFPRRVAEPLCLCQWHQLSAHPQGIGWRHHGRYGCRHRRPHPCADVPLFYRPAQ